MTIPSKKEYLKSVARDLRNCIIQKDNWKPVMSYTDEVLSYLVEAGVLELEIKEGNKRNYNTTEKALEWCNRNIV